MSIFTTFSCQIRGSAGWRASFAGSRRFVVGPSFIFQYRFDMSSARFRRCLQIFMH